MGTDRDASGEGAQPRNGPAAPYSASAQSPPPAPTEDHARDYDYGAEPLPAAGDDGPQAADSGTDLDELPGWTSPEDAKLARPALRHPDFVELFESYRSPMNLERFLANLSFSHLEAATGRRLAPSALEVTASSQVTAPYFGGVRGQALTFTFRAYDSGSADQAAPYSAPFVDAGHGAAIGAFARLASGNAALRARACAFWRDAWRGPTLLVAGGLDTAWSSVRSAPMLTKS